MISVFSTVLGETAFAIAGLSVREAKQKGYNVVVRESEAPNRRLGCMPGTTNLKVKLVFEKGTGILIGGQVMGAKCGGELINTISTCIPEKMTIDDVAIFAMGTFWTQYHWC